MVASHPEMYRLKKARANKPPLIVQKLCEADGLVIYFDPEKKERNARGRAAFDRLFERCG